MKKTKMILIGVLFVLVVAAAVYYSNGISQKEDFLVFSRSAYTIYLLNGSELNGTLPVGRFLLLNTSLQPLHVSMANKTMRLPYNLSSLITNQRPKGFIEKIYLSRVPSISPNGFIGNFTAVLYAGNAVGAGDDVAMVYTNATNWSIYTNGTYYYVENGTYSMYSFMYGNNTSILSIIPYGSSLNNSAVPENSPLFPKAFLPALNNLSRGNGPIAFVKDGSWWYSSRSVVRLLASNLPSNGFTLWR